MKKIELSEITKKIDPVVQMRKEWYLVTARKNDGKVNTMVAAWGGLGNMFEKKVVFVTIRPQRFTKEFVDESGKFTMTFFSGHMDALTLLGSKSGREMPDKIQKSGLTLTEVDGQPAFKEGRLVLVCKVIYKQQYKPECFTEKALAESCYPDKDYSWQYIAEIEAAYEM